MGEHEIKKQYLKEQMNKNFIKEGFYGRTRNKKTISKRTNE